MQPYIEFPDEKLLRLTQSHSNLVKRVKTHGLNPRQSTVLDLGCGQGHNTLALSRDFHKVYGADPSDAMLKDARKNRKRRRDLQKPWSGLEKVRFYKGSFDAIPVKEVDMMTMHNSLHFAENPWDALRTVFAHVRPGGMVFITEPSYAMSKLADKSKEARKKKLPRLKAARKAIKRSLNDNDVNMLFEVEDIYLILLQKRA
jgi:ubiquinone/menaquinone biosynthesis C-methylase UbiE